MKAACGQTPSPRPVTIGCVLGASLTSGRTSIDGTQQRNQNSDGSANFIYGSGRRGALHLWLGWPLWAGVVIVGILATGPGVVQLLGGKATDNEETDKGQERYVRIGFALSAIGATLIAAVLAYIPLIIVNWLMKNPSW
jgi:hypothetical protein